MITSPDKGKFNSSITRVRPVFQRLIGQDRTGVSWLPKLLNLAPVNQDLAFRLSENPGNLLEPTLKIRKYNDRVLKEYGFNEIDLEACFEKRLPPPYRFLRWLIENQDRMKCPGGKFGEKTQDKRDRLFGKAGPDAVEEARREALAELERFGPSRFDRKWWAFEGFTEADCCLETERLVLFIEGKRNESLGSSTNWYPARNQLVRNLEVGQEYAGDKDFAVFVIAEQDIGLIIPDMVNQSLPHFSHAERKTLMKHYLGCILWADLCRSVGINFKKLPNTTADIVRTLR